MSELEDALSKLMQLKRIIDGGIIAAGGYRGLGGKALCGWITFCNSMEKKAILMHCVTFCTCLEPFKRTTFLTFESQLKKLNCSILLLLTF